MQNEIFDNLELSTQRLRFTTTDSERAIIRERLSSHNNLCNASRNNLGNPFTSHSHKEVLHHHSLSSSCEGLSDIRSKENIRDNIQDIIDSVEVEFTEQELADRNITKILLQDISNSTKLTQEVNSND